MIEDARILLVQLPPWDVKTLPLGISYVGGFLKSRGCHVKIFDANIFLYRKAPELLKTIWDNANFFFWSLPEGVSFFDQYISEIVNEILSKDIQIVGFSLNKAGIDIFNKIAVKLKKEVPGCIVVVGGPITYFLEFRNLLNRKVIDYCIIGEGELSLYHLLRDIQLNGISSFGKTDFPEEFKVFKEGNNTLCIQSAPLDINTIPFPYFEDFDLNLYKEPFKLPILASRGCVRHCAFCSDTVMWERYRRRKATSVVEEIKYRISLHPGVHKFIFNDLSFNGDLNFVEELCDLIIKENILIVWEAQATVRKGLTKELLLKMKQSGCEALFFGVENFSDNVLYSMKKGYTAQETLEVFQAAKEAGIAVDIALIIGFPGEKEGDLEETISWLNKNYLFIDRVTSLKLCGIPPGSDLFRYASKYEIINSDVIDWHTRDFSNNIRIRAERAKRVKSCLDMLNIPVVGYNLDFFDTVYL